MMKSQSNSPIFEFVNYSTLMCCYTYKLEPRSLNSNEYHLFFQSENIKKLLNSKESHPENKNSNGVELFHIDTLRCGKDDYAFDLIWCHFPKELRAKYQKIADTYGATMKNLRNLFVDDRGITLELPQAENILVLESYSLKNEQEILEKMKAASKEDG